MDEVRGSGYFREFKTAVEAVEEAGKIIDDYVENGFESYRKEDGSKLTEADTEAQEKIVEVISREFPDDGFLGEEEELEPSGEDRAWVIDPIDGTFNFDHGFNRYCISIALTVDNQEVIGIVYSPKTSAERSFFAVKGAGAYECDASSFQDVEAIQVSETEDFDDSLFFLSLFDIYEGEIDAEVEVLEKIARKGAIHRQIGSCALEMCQVAAGNADFQIVPLVKKWDYAAAKLIVEEAGGKVRARDSKFPDSTEIISSNGLIQEEVEKLVSDSFQ